MIFDIITIFPELLVSPLDEGIIRRARQEKKVEIHTTNVRDYALDKHAMTDDRPFGGGEGMVMKPEPLQGAVAAVLAARGDAEVILMSPQGEPFNQQMAQELATMQHLVLVCGRYEGIDERFQQRHVTREISMVVVDAVTRLIPGVLGCAASAEKDTFSDGLLKHPQYTRPRHWEGMEVPKELLTGNHEQIRQYRFLAAVKRTLERRPAMFRTKSFTAAETKLLKQHGLYQKIAAIQNANNGNGNEETRCP